MPDAPEDPADVSEPAAIAADATDQRRAADVTEPPDAPLDLDDPSADRARLAELATKYQFHRCCTAAFELVVPAWEGHVAGVGAAAGGPSVDEIADALDHGPVAAAFGDLLLGATDHGSAELDAFATGLIDSTSVPHIGALFLRATNAEADGRVLDAEADYAAALAVDPEYRPAIYELARFASDRGDIPMALALYRQVGPTAQPEVEFLESLLPDHRKVGRNDPCPCGSGRKFKQCHLDHPEVPPDRAARWLFHKVLGYGYREQFEPVRAALLRAAAEGAGGPEAAAMLADDPFILDLCVFDTEIIERFDAERSLLLPPDEADMLHDWMAVARRLWEVTAVEVGVRIILRDVLSGESVDVSERIASRSIEVGAVLLTRVVPVRGEHQLIGEPMPIEPEQRVVVADMVAAGADAEEWARWLGTALPSPDPLNTEGERIILAAAVVRPSPDAEATDLLGRRYEPSPEAETRWTDVIEIDGRRITRATLDLEDDGRIVVIADSDERLDRVLDALRSDDPDLVIEAENRQPLTDFMPGDEPGQAPPSGT